MDSPLSRRLFVRVADGTDYVLLLTVSGITTVLLVRAFLALADYPQISTNSLHIAHVLWGGLAMLVALVLALLFVGRGARIWTAILGGVGLGLFVDEVGKFVTNTNDYFYRPAAAIIYIVFAALVLGATLINRDKLTDRPERIVNAAVIATNGLASGLTPQARRDALQMLEGRTEPQAEAVRSLLSSIPDHAHSPFYKRFVTPLENLARATAQRVWILNSILFAFTAHAVFFSVYYIDKSISLLNGEVIDGVVERQAIYLITVSDTVSALLAIVGAALLMTRRRQAIRWFQFAVLVNLLFGQIFNFTDSQFAAVVGLPFNLIALGVVVYLQRKNKTVKS